MELEPLDREILGILAYSGRLRQLHPTLSLDDICGELSGRGKCPPRRELQSRVDSLCEHGFLSRDEKGSYTLGLEAIRTGRY